MDIYPELTIFKQFRRVIVWGFPLHSHTHSYIHGAWVKTFQYLGIPVEWFHDKSYPAPSSYDYSNTCFITEGWAENNIPVRADCTYFVHIAKNPAKYLDAGARLIEIRYNVKEIHDFNYDYILPTDCTHLSPQTLYEVVLNDAAVAMRRGRPPRSQPYEVVYMYWATDLLPHEFNYEDASATHTSNIIYYMGSVSPPHPIYEFKQIATASGIHVILNDPWSAPLGYDENIKRMKMSYCAPDFRSSGQPDKFQQYGRMNGTNHIDIGYIPCRVLKAISYGHTGITNSPRVKEVLGDYVEYAATPNDVLPIVKKREHDVEWRKACMRHVAENHTFLQRVRDLARALLQKKPSPITLVTALYDIGREVIDGRSMENYKEYLKRTLEYFLDPIVIFIDPTSGLRDFILSIRSKNIVIKEVSFNDLVMASYYDKIDTILKDPNFRREHPNDITNRLVGYCQIQYSKFEFIQRTIAENPFNSTHFSWIDAGISRFMRGAVISTPSTFNTQFNIQSDGSHQSITHLTCDNYIGTNRCILKGTLWVFTPSIFERVKDEVMHIWNDEMIAKGRIDNEQQALTIVYKGNTDLFNVHVSRGQIDGILNMFFRPV